MQIIFIIMVEIGNCSLSKCVETEGHLTLLMAKIVFLYTKTFFYT